jgi:hypothetical protein
MRVKLDYFSGKFGHQIEGIRSDGQISSLRKKQSGKRKRENVKFSVGKQEKKRGRRRMKNRVSKNERKSVENGNENDSLEF